MERRTIVSSCGEFRIAIFYPKGNNGYTTCFKKAHNRHCVKPQNKSKVEVDRGRHMVHVNSLTKTEVQKLCPSPLNCGYYSHL